MDLVKIKQILHDEMFEKVSWTGEKSGKYYHGERVAELALKLREYIQSGDNGHDDIIRVAGWFHDIRNGEANHAMAGAERMKILLAEYCTERELEQIYEIIYRHDDRVSDRAKFSIYAKIQQDADFLDHFGAFGIWNGFLIAAKDGRTILEAMENMKEWKESLGTDYEDGLNFDVSKKIYREKAEFYKNFAERFEAECTGGIWNEKIIIGE